MTTQQRFSVDAGVSAIVPTLTEVVSAAELADLAPDDDEAGVHAALDEATWQRLAPRIEQLVVRAVEDVLAARTPELAEAVRAAVAAALRREHDGQPLA